MPCGEFAFEFIAIVLVLLSFFLTLTLILILVQASKRLQVCVEILAEILVSHSSKERNQARFVESLERVGRDLILWDTPT